MEKALQGDAPNHKHSAPSQMKAFEQQLVTEIETAYKKGGYDKGWRLLYSPARNIFTSGVAFVGLNPGGREPNQNNDGFAKNVGSAYENESWSGAKPGQSKLQRQVCALFRFINATPTNVLAGNLVPFRSQNWQSLPHKDFALTFGKKLWTDIFRKNQPSLVIAMGKPTIDSISVILDIKNMQRISVRWGNVKAYKGKFECGNFIGLPHLSRYPLFGRAKSKAMLNDLLLDL